MFKQKPLRAKIVACINSFPTMNTIKRERKLDFFNRNCVILMHLVMAGCIYGLLQENVPSSMFGKVNHD